MARIPHYRTTADTEDAVAFRFLFQTAGADSSLPDKVANRYNYDDKYLFQTAGADSSLPDGVALEC